MTSDCLNSEGRSVPVVHAQGEALFIYADVLHALRNRPCSVPDWVGIVTCCTQPLAKDAVLITQLQKHKIPFVNPAEECQDWKNALKPGFILAGIEALPEHCTHALVLDALDVALNGAFIRCLQDYQSYGKPVLFGATRNNSPDVVIDRVRDRDWRGAFRYLNAGTSFGPRDAMTMFYRMVEDIIEEYPECEREQPLVRAVFDQCQSWVDFDWRCVVFQTLSNSIVTVDDNDMVRVS